MSEKNVLLRIDEIINSLQYAELEDVDALLNYYNCGTITIDGIKYESFDDPVLAARLNARYFKLTGKDHPVYLQQVPKAIEKLESNAPDLIKNQVYSENYFEKIETIKSKITGQANNTEIVEGNHPILNFNNVVNNIANASLDDVSEQLNYYHSGPIMINGELFYPFDDLETASILNDRYFELTGTDHPNYIKYLPKNYTRSEISEPINTQQKPSMVESKDENNMVESFLTKKNQQRQKDKRERKGLELDNDDEYNSEDSMNL